MPRLTKPFCETVAPPATGYEIQWDDKVPGYGLRVTAPNKTNPEGVRAFVAQGRVKGKAVIITIGRLGLYTEDQARRKAQSLLQQMREGVDPRDVKRTDEAMSVTLREVADAYFARPGMLKEGTRVEMDRHVEKVFAKWKDRPIASITPDECRKRFTEMVTKGLRGKKGAPVSAVLSFATLRTLIKWAMKEYTTAEGNPIIAVNPVANLIDDMRKHKAQARDRRVEVEDVGTFWHWLHTERANPKNLDAQAGIDLILFLLLTGARKMEGAALEWRNVNLDEGWWFIADPKNKKPTTLPLSAQTVEVLKRRRALDDGPFVFASRSKTGHISDPRASLERFATVLGMGRLSPHDLRRTFVEVGASGCGLDVAKVSLLVNHSLPGVTGKHYLKTDNLRAYKPEVQKIGDYIEQQGLIAASDNVVPLPLRA
jgi:integrase